MQVERFCFTQLWRVIASLSSDAGSPSGVCGETSALFIAELLNHLPLLSIVAEDALHDINILDFTAMFVWRGL
jgi:hypothetical protein